MYEDFYGLVRTPFAVTPDPAMLFMSRVHREALATIIYGVETRKGFMVCTGEVGTGKSTIIRAFFDQARADAVKLIYIFTPQVSPLEMAQYICGELEMEHPESIFAAVPRLQFKLLEFFESGKTVVLMIDEAQQLPPETLEFLRLLSNFETDTEKLIQIVLVGQPEVDTMLARPDMRQVNQRIALRARLAPLSLEESFEYIAHRLQVSGAGGLPQVMSPSAAWLIAEAAGGIPRRINILADNVLIAGFGVGQRPLGSHITGNVIREFTANSGPARPAQGERQGTGWRAARRFRGALSRERNEPADWVSAAPEPPPAAPMTAPMAMTSAEPAPRVPAGSVVISPRPAAAAAPMAPKPPPARSSSTAPTLVEPIFVEPVFVEPVFVDPGGPQGADEWQVTRLFEGTPVSAADIVVVATLAPEEAVPERPVPPPPPAPVAQPVATPPPPPLSPPTAVNGHARNAAPPRVADPRPLPIERAIPGLAPRADNGAGSRIDAVMAAAAVHAQRGRSVQWPALSRIRGDLQTAPRRPPGG